MIPITRWSLVNVKRRKLNTNFSNIPVAVNPPLWMLMSWSAQFEVNCNIYHSLSWCRKSCPTHLTNMSPFFKQQECKFLSISLKWEICRRASCSNISISIMLQVLFGGKKKASYFNLCEYFYLYFTFLSKSGTILVDYHQSVLLLLWGIMNKCLYAYLRF